MSSIHPLAAEHLRARWTRPDAWRFAAPGSPEAVRPGWLDPRARPRDRAAEAKARGEREDFERELRKLRCDFAWLEFEIALRRHFQRKYSPDQPRVPAGRAARAGGGRREGERLSTQTRRPKIERSDKVKDRRWRRRETKSLARTWRNRKP